MPTDRDERIWALKCPCDMQSENMEVLRELKGCGQTLVLWWPGSFMQFMDSRTPCCCL